MSSKSKQIYPTPFIDGQGPGDSLDGDLRKEEKAKRALEMGSGSPFSMENRDPNNLNPHLQIMWDDIVGEPEGLRTPTSCWNCSYKCYDCSRQCCYVFLVVLFGPIIALINGCNFACLSFNQIWCVGPCYRHFKINMATFRKFWETCLMACFSPMVAVAGLFFSNIKIRYQKLNDATDKEPTDHFNV